MNSTTANNKENHNPYPKFFLMLAASFIIMYVVMYLNTYEWDHVYFSMTRFYMTCLMITCMALLMLLFMLKMYNNKKKQFCHHYRVFIALFRLALFSSVAEDNRRRSLDESNDSTSLDRDFDQ